MQSVIQDFRFALRLWRQRPGFTAIALLSLALGIGANTSIFSLMDALMLRSLPVQNPRELMLFGPGRQSGMMIGFPQDSEEMFSQAFLKTVRQKNAVFSEVGAVESMVADVHARFAHGELEPLHIRLVTGNYFTLLGVGPAVGRVLAESDDQNPGGRPVAVMSHRLWQRRFSKDASVVGRAVTFNGTAFTVIGVAAKEFSGTVVDESPDLWIPLAMQQQVQPWFQNATGTMMQSLWLTGRLKAGVSRAAAEANTNVVFQQWLHEVAGASPSAERVADMKKARIDLHEAATGISDLRRKFSDPLEILMVLVGVVLLIACVNIANLMLAQATGRQREIAVRLALGANRGRLTSQFLSESLMLSLMGGALGVLIAWWGGQLLLTLVQADPANPLPIQVGPNARVLLFTFGLSLVTGVFFGLAPALRMAHVDLAPSLREGKGTARSRSRSRVGQVLVAGQVALALFLMIGAGLFVRTLQKLEQTGAGFDAGSAVLLHLDSDASNFKGPAVAAMHRKLIERLRGLPGVQAASFSMLNFNEGRWMTRLWPEGVPHLESNGKPVDGNQVGTQYFTALGMPVVMGRSFGPQDTPQSQAALVVNETMARALYPGVSPIGRHVAMEGERPDLEIVGVVKDAKYENLRDTPRGMFFVDLDQNKIPDTFSDLVVRVAGNPEALMSQIRATVHAVDPNLAVWDVMTLRDAVDRSLGQEKLLAKLASFFGALALLLSAIGLYGVMAYSVARRTNEIGIRMALGAQPGAVLGMVLRESVFVVGLGLLAGIPAALACGRYVASQLYGLAPNDPVTIVGAAVLLIAVALLASYLPARRAAMLDPLAALREE
jgi:predicted permease